MRLAVFGFIALLILSLAWFLQEDPGTSGDHGKVSETVLVDDEDPVPPQGAGAPTVVPSGVDREDIPAEDLPNLMPQPRPEEDHLLIEVFLGTGKKPAPFATVYVLNDEAMRARMIEVDFFPNADFSLYFSKFGDAYRTDANGHARLPVPRDRLVVSALKEGLFGMNYMVTSGTRSLSLYLEPLLFVSAKVAAPGGIVDLGEIDLRGMLKVIRLTVVDHNHAPMEGVSLRSVGSYFTRPLAEQPAEMVTRDGSLDLHISADGHPSILVEGIRGDREIVLAKGIPVRLFLDNHRQLSQGIEWVPRLIYYPDGPEAEPVSGSDVKLKPVFQGVWESGVAHAGTYRLKFTIRNRDSNAAWVLSSEPFYLDVEDGSSVQDFHYTLEQSILDFAQKKDT